MDTPTNGVGYKNDLQLIVDSYQYFYYLSSP